MLTFTSCIDIIKTQRLPTYFNRSCDWCVLYRPEFRYYTDQRVFYRPEAELTPNFLFLNNLFSTHTSLQPEIIIGSWDIPYLSNLQTSVYFTDRKWDWYLQLFFSMKYHVLSLYPISAQSGQWLARS